MESEITINTAFVCQFVRPRVRFVVVRTELFLSSYEEAKNYIVVGTPYSVLKIPMIRSERILSSNNETKLLVSSHA
jgi:hypothetical protein